MVNTVLSMTEVRDQLPTLIDQFTADDTAPVVFGAHRTPEAVLIPYALYLELTQQTTGS